MKTPTSRTIPPHVVEAVRYAWAEFDRARDANDWALAKAIREGLDQRARMLGLNSADDLANL